MTLGLGDQQMAEQLGAPPLLLLDCRRVYGQRPLPLQKE